MKRRLIIFFICFLQTSLMFAQSGQFAEIAWAEYVRWMALIGLCALVSPPRGKRIRDFTLVDAIVGVFTLVGLCSITQSHHVQTSVLRFLSIVLLYVAVFWTLWHFADHEAEETVVRCLVWCMSLFLIGGLVATQTGLAAYQSDGRFKGLMANPNSAGLLGAIAFPLVLSQALARRRWVDGAFLLAVVASVLLSGSRTSAVSCACATGFILLKARISRGLLVLIVAGGLATVLLTIRPWEKSQEFQGTTLFSNPLTRLTFQDDTLLGGGRFEMWPRAVEAIMESPVLGHGFGTEEHWMDDANLSEGYFGISQGKYMHNSYLGLSYQLGLFGAAVLFIPLFVLGAKRFIRLLRRQLTLEQAGYTGVLLAGLVACFSESWVYSVGNAFAFPFWTAVMLSIRRQTLEDRRIAPSRSLVSAERTNEI